MGLERAKPSVWGTGAHQEGREDGRSQTWSDAAPVPQDLGLLWMPPTTCTALQTQQEPFHPIRHQSTSQSWLGRDKSPPGPFRLPQQEPSRSFHHLCPPIVLQTCQTWLSGCPAPVNYFTHCFGWFRALTKLSSCSASLTTRGRAVTSTAPRTVLEQLLLCVWH